MGLEQHRYRATILRVCRTDTGTEQNFSEICDYHDLSYGQLVILNEILVQYADDIIRDLSAAGIAIAAEAGVEMPIKQPLQGKQRKAGP